MSKAARLKRQVLQVLDPGKKNRGVLRIQPSGGIEINTNRILSSARGRVQIRTIKKMAAEREELGTV